MHDVTPEVHLISKTGFDHGAFAYYLEGIGVTKFHTQEAAPDVEELIRAAGKFCYRSWEPGLNPNVTKVRDDPEEYLLNLLAVGHGSVLEHGNMTFLFHNVSRVFTHELVRHRVGAAYSQESLRYVRLTELGFWIPEPIQTKMEGTMLMRRAVRECEGWQKELAKIYDIDNPDLKFSEKKKLTSAFRRIAPIGLATGIIMTMNIRTLMHLIQMRTSRHAEEEIRAVFDAVAKLAQAEYPSLFKNFVRKEVQGYGEWTTPDAGMPYDGDKLKALRKTVAKQEAQIQLLQDQLDDSVGRADHDD